MTGRDKSSATDRIASVKDEDIDSGDIPELDNAFWREAVLVEPNRTGQITIRVRRSVLDHFRAPGRGCQARTNRVLESYVRARRNGSDISDPNALRRIMEDLT